MKIKVESVSEEKLNTLGVKDWPIWEKERSSFDWHYSKDEVCYLLEGRVIVKTEEEEVEFGAGDLVTFPAGLSCHWKIEEDVKKHYKLG
ncbi:cupin domain-containing protein [Halonatronum saccharophilum]|uniref:cupin domain-containing protein n=1 Tax=Halonatronum saccharophilum TaxID=150060 RepID=UPI000482EA4A|nr:cupin domain-containing protein [Halonatronum saccharophilum]